MSKLTQHLIDQEFDQKVTQSKGLVLVDFWADWCGPCKVVGPIVDELAERHIGAIQVYKMDVDANPETPTRFKIKGIPTVILFKDGKPVDQIVGSYPREFFEKTVQSHL
jgi:thioredoxin 1